MNNDLLKRCSKCKKLKSINMFGVHTSGKNGLRAACKRCHNATAEKSHAKNRDQYLEMKKKRHILNRERDNAAVRKWRAKYPDKLKALCKKWRDAHPVAMREITKRRHAKARSTTTGRLNESMGQRMRQSLLNAKANRHWEDLITYTLTQLRKHLEKRFLPGMTWENYGQWHVDHKIPLAVFNFEKPEDIDFKRAWALKNLRPLWAIDNYIKGARLDKPFQPSLTI